jgi:hypothetical protein
VFVLFHLGDGFRVGEEEDRFTLGERELGVGLVGRIRDAANGADHYDVQFLDHRVFALERIGGCHGGVVLFRGVVLDAVAVVVVVFVDVGFAFVLVFVVVVVLVVGVFIVVMIAVVFSVGLSGNRGRLGIGTKPAN